MTRNERIQLLVALGDYLRTQSDDPVLQTVIERAHAENQWFTEDNIRQSLNAIAETMLAQDALEAWAALYPDNAPAHPERTVGLIMAGNIPLVGFHDWMCVFVAGHRARIKLSEKDKIMIRTLMKNTSTNVTDLASRFGVGRSTIYRVCSEPLDGTHS